MKILIKASKESVRFGGPGQNLEIWLWRPGTPKVKTLLRDSIRKCQLRGPWPESCQVSQSVSGQVWPRQYGASMKLPPIGWRAVPLKSPVGLFCPSSPDFLRERAGSFRNRPRTTSWRHKPKRGGTSLWSQTCPALLTHGAQKKREGAILTIIKDLNYI